MSKIFVSIASYRDPQTPYTIIDLLDKADNKKNIIIGLCLQHEKNEIDLPKFSNLKVIEYNWRESQGACWARYNIQKFLYDGEDYYFQLDSHHRFCKSWDTMLINMLQKLKTDYPKPIIGGYCPKYLPDKDKELEHKALQINCLSDFTDVGDLIFVPRAIKNFDALYQNNRYCIPARFLSGHFLFTDGVFCDECIYDPNLYFRGEELTLSVRAYTHGYDLFHPTIPIVWHQYTREGENKHWTDHTENNGFITSGSVRSNKAKQRARILLGMEKNDKLKLGKYGLGKSRSLHEYELYAGLKFSTRQIHKYTYDINNVYSYPKVLDENEWSSGLMQKYNLSIQIPEDYLSKINTEPKPAQVTILCNNQINIACYRKDIKKNNLHILSAKYNTSASMESEPHHVYMFPYNHHIKNFTVNK
jgi:hypothetical protein